MNKGNIIMTVIASTLLTFNVGDVFSASSYLPGLDEYRGVGPYVLEKPYSEYKNSTIQKKGDSDFSSGEEQAGTGTVQVKTVFDFYEDKRSENIDFVRNTLLEKIKNKEFSKTGFDDIDRIIDKLESPGKYFVIKTEGDVIPVNEDNLIYVFDYKISGDEKLIEFIKNEVSKIGADKTQSITEKNANLANTLKILDKYKIKYARIGKSQEASFFIGKGNGAKIEGREKFFPSKLFTTPELRDKVEAGKTIPLYFWTFVTDEELRTKYYAENGGAGSDAFARIFGDTVFLGNVKNGERVYQSLMYPSKKDVYLYVIKKNPLEYAILFIMFFVGTILGAYMTMNFVSNFRNNFKKTPEEL